MSRISSSGKSSTAASGSGKSKRPLKISRTRSEEHTSELQSLAYLVCRLLLEKKKKTRLSSPNETHTDGPLSRRPRRFPPLRQHAHVQLFLHHLPHTPQRPTRHSPKRIRTQHF